MTLEQIEACLDAAEKAYKLAINAEQVNEANDRVNYWYGKLKLKLDELDTMEVAA